MRYFLFSTITYYPDATVRADFTLVSKYFPTYSAIQEKSLSISDGLSSKPQERYGSSTIVSVYEFRDYADYEEYHRTEPTEGKEIARKR